MKLQNLTIIFIIIILPIVLVLSAYIGYEVKTINKQNMYNTGVNTAVHDAVFAYEMNSKNDDYSDNAENKRSNIKASVKTFENSLSNACNLGLYNNDAIEEYIPALVFGMYDGFYMYAPSETKNGYKHNLRNFVYYSEEISGSNYDLIIRYTLDNYVAVSGTIDGTYITKAGYLINLDKCNNYNWKKTKSPDDKIEEATLLDNFTYEGVSINEKEELIYTTLSEDKTELISNSSEPEKDSTAIEYYKEAIAFSEWFNEYIISKNVSSEYGYLSIKDGNDPEKEDSKFVQHKNQIIKEKMENVLNSSITAYANKTRNSYKMPKFNEEEWKKIYNNISIVALVQGMNLGFKTYNNYCIVSSTNNNEYVNPNLLYFTDGNSYHDIRCTEIAEDETTGYRIGDFEQKSYEEVQKDEEGNELKDATGTVITKDKYYYKHNELACYKCVNGSIESTKSIYDYVRDNEVNSKVRSSYFTSLARERYKTTKLLSSYNDVDARYYTITYKYTNKEGKETTKQEKYKKGEEIQLLSTDNLDIKIPEGNKFVGWSDGKETYTAESKLTLISNIELTPKFETIKYEVTFESKDGVVLKKVNVQHGGSISKPTFQKTGYKQGDIYADKEFQKKFDFNTKIYNSITLYVEWIPLKCEVLLYNKGNLYDTITADYDSEISLPELKTAAVKTYFIGWSTKENDQSKKVGSKIKITSLKSSYYALWVEGVVARRGDKYYKTLSEAINAIDNVKYISLLSNVTENIRFGGYIDRTLNLGGHAINGTITNNSYNVSIINGTIMGRIVNERNENTLNVKAELTLRDVTVNISDDDVVAITNYCNINIYDTGVIMSGGHSNNVLINNAGGEFHMYSGKIIAKSTNAIKVQNGSKLIISGGTVENTYSGPTIYAVRTNAFDENKVTINGGSIINNGKGAAIINYTEYYTGIFSKKWKYSKLVLASNVKIKGAVGESHP